MFSFKQGIPIALVSDGKHKNKLLKLIKDVNEDEVEHYEEDPLELISDILNSQEEETKRYLTPKEIEELEYCIRDDVPPSRAKAKLSRLFKQAKEMIKARQGKEMILYEGQLVPMPIEEPDEDQNERIYLAAPSGSGKSVWANQWIRMYLKLHPRAKIYVFSKLGEDVSLDYNIPPKQLVRVALDETFLEGEPLSASDFDRDSVVVFDDITSIKDKSVLQAVKKLRDELLETGRHQNISIIDISHLITNYKESRTSLNEATTVVLFPKSGSGQSINYYLRQYLGLDQPTIKKIVKLPSRWVAISKRAPRFVLYDKGAFVLE